MLDFWFRLICWSMDRYTRCLLQIYVSFFLLCVLGSFDLKKADPRCEVDCLNGGTCRNDSCICGPGFTGAFCESCFGRVRLNAPQGIVSDGFGNYSANLRCTWFIDGSGHASRITLRFDSFATECGWDHFYVFEGDNSYGRQLSSLRYLMLIFYSA